MNNQKDELREILERMEIEDLDGISIDEALTNIRSWISRQLPEEKAVDNLGLGYDEDLVRWRKGFNECLRQVKSNLLSEGK